MQQAGEQLRDGLYEDAIETLTAVLALSPGDLEALRGRGVAYAQLKQWNLAVADLGVAKGAAPDDVDTWINWANSLAMANQVYEAIQAFETLVARQPRCLRAHLELGRLHLRLGAIPKGREHLQLALACRPTGAQRQVIVAILEEQDRLDQKRMYRPDFDALHKQRARQRKRTP